MPQSFVSTTDELKLKPFTFKVNSSYVIRVKYSRVAVYYFDSALAYKSSFVLFFKNPFQVTPVNS